MKRILTALCIATALLGSYAHAKGPAKTEARKTKYICTIGLEGEGSFTEVYKDREECARYCKGGATICEETGINNPIDIDDVD